MGSTIVLTDKETPETRANEKAMKDAIQAIRATGIEIDDQMFISLMFCGTEGLQKLFNRLK